jgi:DNA-binding transcriptional ArsR family regulator
MLPRPIPDPIIQLISRRLEVLAEPTRIRLIDLLDDGGEDAVHQLADRLGLTTYNVSQHLGVLRDAGSARRRRTPANSRWSGLGDESPIAHSVVNQRAGDVCSSGGEVFVDDDDVHWDADVAKGSTEMDRIGDLIVH